MGVKVLGLLLTASTALFTAGHLAYAQDNAPPPYQQQPTFQQQPPPYQQQQPPYEQQQPPYEQQQPPYQQQQQPYPQSGPSQPDQSQQDPSDADQDGNDPQRGVARISIVQGDVNVKRGDTGELVAASINAPLMVQDHLQTSPGSRAEIQLDSGHMIRVGPNTDVGFSDLQYHRYQVQLGAGSIIYRVLRDVNSQAEIDTPSISVRPMGRGEYRISVLDDGTTQVTVRSGELEVFSPQGSQRLRSGSTMLVRGSQQNPEFQTTAEVGRDQMDQWSENRDRQLLASQSYRHVNPDVYGADDLDAYGSWVPSQYGTVWAPRPPVAGWAPYSDGHWAWEDYYGWTWVDNAPWGWAPFHYGSWFWNTGISGWAWHPGAFIGSHFWRPALVGFFGFGGGGFNVGIGFGGIGWCPLAPFERFHPWYGRGFYGGYFGRGGFNNVNIIRNSNITNIYRNAGINGAVRYGNYNGFGGPNQRFGVASREQLRSASLFRGQMPVTPTAASTRFANRQAMANPRLNSVSNRSFFQHQRPPSVARASFAQQSSHLQQSSQRAFGRMGGQGNNAQNTGRGFAQNPGQGGGYSRFGGGQGGMSPQNSHGVPPNMRNESGFQGNSRMVGSQNGGWQHFGQPGPSSNSFNRGATTGSSSEQSGWHRFGEPQRNSPASGFNSGRNNSGGYNSGRNSFGRPSSGYQSPSRDNYQSRPLGTNPSPGRGYSSGGGGSPQQHYNAPSTPHYSAPSPQRYSAPSAPHYNAPSNRGGGGGGYRGGGSGGGSHGGGGSHSGGGGGGSHSGGGGSHGGGGGHHGH
jgi:hypothetical protein